MTDPWRPPDPNSPWTGPQWSPGPRPDAAEPAGDLRWDGPVGFAPVEEQAPFDIVRWLRETAVAAGLPVLAMVLLGAPVGLLWARVTPRVGIAESASGLELKTPEGSAFFAADGWFFVLSVVVGVAAGAGLWRVLRRRGPAVPVGIALGALIAANVAREVGGRVIVDGRVYDYCHRAGASCGLYDGRVQLRATGVLATWAIAALVAFMFLTALFDHEPAPVAGEAAWWTTRPGGSAWEPPDGPPAGTPGAWGTPPDPPA